MPPKRKRSSPDASENPPAKRARTRERTSLHIPELRPLDALARLLEGPSQCVAITMVGQQCLIAANELKATSRKEKNRCIRHIDKVMSFFRSDKKYRKKERIQFLIEIFSPYCKKLAKDLIIPDGLINDIVEQVVTEQKKDFSLLKGYKKHLESAGFVLAAFIRFYRDFSKVEKFSENELKMVFASEPNILLEVKEDNVHAEIQLLEKILRERLYKSLQGKGSLHFGISKLCCAQCYDLLMAAKDVFKEKGIDLQFDVSGKHDLSFQKKWAMPAFFLADEIDPMDTSSDGERSVAIGSVTSLEKDLAVKIGEQAQKQFLITLALPPPRDVYQRTSISSGSFSQSPLSWEHKLQQQKDNLESMLRTVKQLPYPTLGNIAILELGIKLLNTENYKDFLDRIESEKFELKGLPEPSVIFTDFSVFFTSQSETDMARKFLTCQAFVGRKIADYFLPILSDKKSPSPGATNAFFTAKPIPHTETDDDSYSDDKNKKPK